MQYLNGVEGPFLPFLQLDIKQTGELLKLLQGSPCFYTANDPENQIQWENDILKGISEFIVLPEVQRPRPIREIVSREHELDTSFESPSDLIEEYDGPRYEVEGSTEYLRIILPSSEHPAYKRVLRLLREWNFLRDRSHRHWWWLRDTSKVLDFLANHQDDFEQDFEAEFTENFRNQTDDIEKAELRTEASESGDFTEVEVRIEAGAVPCR